jgi:hypothetical protein
MFFDWPNTDSRTAEASYAAAGAPNAASDAAETSADPYEKNLYRLDSLGEYDLFTNYVHGCSLKLTPE